MPSERITVETLEALARRALAHGQWPLMAKNPKGEHLPPVIRRRLRWDVSGRCQAPVAVELFSRHSGVIGKEVKPYMVELKTPCRRCGWCLMQRRWLWASRAKEEYELAERTWFCTMTFSPQQHYEAELIARNEIYDFDSLSKVAKFSALVSVHGRELTRFLKRVRKNSRAPIRYLVVAEAHKSGLPHFHMLIHEPDALRPVRKEVLKDAWHGGFAKWVLMHDSRSAVYLCKYLAKDALTRVRASFHYGQGSIAHAHSVHRLPEKEVVEKGPSKPPVVIARLESAE